MENQNASLRIRSNISPMGKEKHGHIRDNVWLLSSTLTLWLSAVLERFF